ncbi:E3 ubiquitin-protein ligase PUB22 [Arachis ipaensis]|uniref:E3 ubiquitin-protein ligase PUB22 n=1 Tax=Arachis ipaensis TaxID=130454 RepID=UPI0007AFAD77|nr:E3 ubiquitin-protein ligase PUB22 [Arachis ipaensis]
MDNEIDVPPFFLCPISLEIMKDPVTVSTGITYDRESIETWLFSAKNNTCPVTKQQLSSSDFSDLTPNHTLRRLIQSWCTINASHGIQRIPTPKPPVNRNQISKLLKDASRSTTVNQIKCLRKLKSIASGSETNKRCMEAAGAVDFLASVVNNNIDCSSSDHHDDDDDDEALKNSPSDEALSMLYNLHVSEAGLKNLIGFKNGEFVNSLTRILQKGTYDSRAYAVFLLKSMCEVAEPVHLLHLRTELFVELVQVLKDQISHKATKAALHALIQISSWGRNSHGAGLAIVSKKILRVSTMANDRAVRILLSVAKFSATPVVVQEMLKLGVVAKLCLSLQVDSGSKTKEKAREILKIHAKAWKNSPCIPTNLASAYPAFA